MGKKENESTKREYWTHSACSMSTTCPLKIKVRDGKIVEIKGEDVPGWDIESFKKSRKKGRGKICRMHMG
jgi:hypothetical protein